MSKYIIFSVILVMVLIGCCPEVAVKKCPEQEPVYITNPCEPCLEKECPPERVCPEHSESIGEKVRIGVADISLIYESAGIKRMVERFRNSPEAQELLILDKTGENPQRKKELEKIILKKKEELHIQAHGLVQWAMEEKLNGKVDILLSKDGKILWPPSKSSFISIIEITDELIFALE